MKTIDASLGAQVRMFAGCSRGQQVRSAFAAGVSDLVRFRSGSGPESRSGPKGSGRLRFGPVQVRIWAGVSDLVREAPGGSGRLRFGQHKKHCVFYNHFERYDEKTLGLWRLYF